LESDQAKKFVAEVLAKSGVPLQLQVAAICREYTARFPDRRAISNIGRLVYSTGENGDIYREVDHALRMSKHFSVGPSDYEWLNVIVLIECKSRENVSYFVFKDDVERFREAAPVATVLVNTPLVKQLRTRSTPVDVHAEVVAVRSDDGKTPKTLEKENLLYNAAGSLYDFIAHDIDVEDIGRQRQALVNAATESGALEQMAKRKFEAVKLRCDAADLVSEEIVARFFDIVTNNWYDWGITCYLPIVCVNGPIYEAQLESAEFTPLDFAYCSFRKQGWPGAAWAYLVNQRPEATAILTNPTGLGAVLDMARRLFETILERARTVEPMVAQRAPLAAARAVNNRDRSKYRSDNIA
jgi:hypothetical protein